MRARTGERGAALLIVMVAVVVLTALAVDLAYDTRVSLRIAANARDELQATYLAKGGVAISRLVLSFQQDLDAKTPPTVPGMPPLPRPQLWRILRVDSALAGGLFGGGGAAPAPLAAVLEGGGEAGPPPGGFEAVLEDEARKVNVQLDASAGLLAAQVQALYQLMCDARWDPLFDREDENGQRYSRQDLLIYLHDWVDIDAQSSALAAGFPAPCALVLPQGASPFEAGFQDEDYPYQRGEDRYHAKNARLDSLAELSLVAGVTDAFLAAFGDQLTVYLPVDAKRSVNVNDKAGLLSIARGMALNPQDPLLDDPAFAERLQKLWLVQTFNGTFAIAPVDLAALVEMAGVAVGDPKRFTDQNNPSNPFTAASSVFRVRATGRAGDVRKTIDAVVSFPPKPQPGQIVVVPGKLVHWREE